MSDASRQLHLAGRKKKKKEKKIPVLVFLFTISTILSSLLMMRHSGGDILQQHAGESTKVRSEPFTFREETDKEKEREKERAFEGTG